MQITSAFHDVRRGNKIFGAAEGEKAATPTVDPSREADDRAREESLQPEHATGRTGQVDAGSTPDPSRAGRGKARQRPDAAQPQKLCHRRPAAAHVAGDQGVEFPTVAIPMMDNAC